MGTVDLDAARAARAEARGKGQKPHQLTFNKETFDLPVELPAEFAIGLAMGDYRSAIAALLEPKAAAKFWSFRPSMPDVEHLANEVSKLYAAGDDEGESGASGSSS